MAETEKKVAATEAAAEKKPAAKKATAAKKPAAKKAADGEAKPAAKKTTKKAADGEAKPAAKKTAAKKAEVKAGTVTVKLTKSLSGRGAKQIATAKSLGLKKIGDVTVQPDNAQTAGKIAKISHMVAVTKA
ncbi:MAG TPA: 50S ribosomal protein L30 [Candidatus Fournierella excrementavium]|nr:50S ribosomal protein L30 [Candidatus Fournierella excrementavium]